MPTHDIIDNGNEKLVDHILEFLARPGRALLAVGYFLLSRFQLLTGTRLCS